MIPLLPVIGAGLVVLGSALFWAAIQNWLADAIERLIKPLGVLAKAAQTALVVLDRVIVNGQRIFLATARFVLPQAAENDAETTIEEVREIHREDLPLDILQKLERGELLQYELSIGSMKIVEKNVTPTYRLVVRRAK